MSVYFKNEGLFLIYVTSPIGEGVGAFPSLLLPQILRQIKLRPSGMSLVVMAGGDKLIFTLPYRCPSGNQTSVLLAFQ